MSDLPAKLLNEPEDDGETPLIAASLRGDEAIVEYLLAEGADIEAARNDGITALLAASLEGHLRVVEIILDHFDLLPSDEDYRANLDEQIRVSIWASSTRGHTIVSEAIVDKIGIARAISLFPGLGEFDYGELSSSDLSKIIAQHIVAAATGLTANSLPDDLPIKDDEALSLWPCVVAPKDSATFARLPLRPASPSDVELFNRLVSELEIDGLNGFTISEPRSCDLPFLLGSKLVLLSHRTKEFSVPFIMSEDALVFLRRENEIIYRLLESRQPGWTDVELLSLTHLFFASVIGRMGAFYLVDNIDHVRWTSAATDSDRQRILPHLFPIQFLDRRPGGRHRLRASVLFKNALFHTDILALDDPKSGSNGISPFELVNETLVLEDLPVEFGMHIDLVVRE